MQPFLSSGARPGIGAEVRFRFARCRLFAVPVSLFLIDDDDAQTARDEGADDPASRRSIAEHNDVVAELRIGLHKSPERMQENSLIRVRGRAEKTARRASNFNRSAELQ